MAAVEWNQPATMQDTNEAIKDAVEVKISSTDSCSTNQFLTLCHYGLHTKNLVVVIPAWFFASLTLFLWVSKFTFGVWQSTSRGVVRASCAPSTKKKKKKSKNFFWRVWRYFCKICTIKNFQLYGTTFLLFWANAYGCLPMKQEKIRAECLPENVVENTSSWQQQILPTVLDLQNA